MTPMPLPHHPLRERALSPPGRGNLTGRLRKDTETGVYPRTGGARGFGFQGSIKLSAVAT